MNDSLYRSSRFFNSLPLPGDFFGVKLMHRLYDEILAYFHLKLITHRNETNQSHTTDLIDAFLLEKNENPRPLQSGFFGTLVC